MIMPREAPNRKSGTRTDLRVGESRSRRRLRERPRIPGTRTAALTPWREEVLAIPSGSKARLNPRSARPASGREGIPSAALGPGSPRRRGLPGAPDPAARRFGRWGRPVSVREDLRGTRGGGEGTFSPPGSRLYDVRRPAPIPRRRSPRFGRPESAPVPAGGATGRCLRIGTGRRGPASTTPSDFCVVKRPSAIPFLGERRGSSLRRPSSSPGPLLRASRLTEVFALVDDLLAGEHTAGRIEEVERRSRDGSPDCGTAAPREL